MTSKFASLSTPPISIFENIASTSSATASATASFGMATTTAVPKKSSVSPDYECAALVTAKKKRRNSWNMFQLLKPFFIFARSQETQQNMNVFIIWSTEIFKIVIASLLTLFVPQSCAAASFGMATGDHLCSIKENMSDLTTYNTFVVALNFATLFYFIIVYCLEVSRERWMISHLEYDKNENEYSLYKYSDDYPEIMATLKTYNRIYFTTYVFLRYLYFCNIIFSGILVFYYYLDYRTATTFVTNIILCWGKVIKGHAVARRSLNENIALSYYNIQYISFNTIDPKFLKKLPAGFAAAADHENRPSSLFQQIYNGNRTTNNGNFLISVPPIISIYQQKEEQNSEDEYCGEFSGDAVASGSDHNMPLGYDIISLSRSKRILQLDKMAPAPAPASSSPSIKSKEEFEI